MPFTSVVFPAPRSPLRRTSLGGLSRVASSRPRAIVSSGDVVVNSRVIPCCVPSRISIAGWRLEAAAPVARVQAEEVAVPFGLDHTVQNLMSLIIQRHEAEWLQNAALNRAYRIEHFGHPLHVAGIGLECNLDEIAAGKGLGQLQQTAGRRHRLETGLGADAIAQLNHRRRSS